MNKIKISAVVIVKNEQKNIERCLKSLSWADEIVVYDSGSTDQTVAIAQKMGAKVSQGAWFGFGPTKAHASSLARNEWILSIDADEEVPQALAQEIQSKFPKLNAQTAYALPRLSFYLGKWIRYGGWYPDYQVRLFNKTKSMWNKAEIHEKVESSQQEKLASHLNHYVFVDIEHQVQTNNRYSSLLAQKLYDSGKRFSMFHFLTKPYVKFFECYFLKLGFLDGWAGYVIARNAAYSVYLKWVKLWELQK